MAGTKKPLRILGLADLHDRIKMLDKVREIDADLIVFCGDLHNAGNRETARHTAYALACQGPPVLIVPGNMDHRDFVPDLWARIKIVVVHQPPRGAQDTLYNGESSGSVSLRRFVEEYQPDLLLCGQRVFHRLDQDRQCGRAAAGVCSAHRNW